MRTRRVFSGLAGLGAIALLHCGGGEPEAPAPPDVPTRVDVFLGKDGIRILGAEATKDAEPIPPRGYGTVRGRTLVYEFRATTPRATSAGGSIDDPRFVEADGLDAPRLGPSGVLHLDLPAAEGNLVIRTEDGAEIGHAHVDPAALDSADEIVNLSRDVIGAPRRLAFAGAAARVNFLVVPEGYTQAELPRFHDDAKKIVDGLAHTDGFDRVFYGVNVWMQDIRSKESGISDPEAGVVKDTAFGITFDAMPGIRRAIAPAANVQDASYAALAKIARKVRADAVIVVVNTKEHAGMRVSENVFVSVADTSVLTIGHELGHLLFGLADEYTDNAGPCVKPLDRPRPNVAEALDAIPWADMLTTRTLPTPANAPRETIGAFEGAKACPKGLWRPQVDCKMRSLGAPFCKVCARALETFFRQRGITPR